LVKVVRAVPVGPLLDDPAEPPPLLTLTRTKASTTTMTARMDPPAM